MSKFYFFIITISLMTSCIGKHTSDAQKVILADQIASQSPSLILDTLRVDLAKSKLYWKGTKLRGAGKHEGEIQLISAYLLHKDGQIQGGEFNSDMTSITVTDIPREDSIPIRNITNHLKSEDFFDVEKYPISTFVITHIKETAEDNLEISGNLTIKGITQHIQFKAFHQDRRFSARFTFDRFGWKIAYEGITNKTTVDREIELRIELLTEY